jgi:hypothetical protein
MAPAKKRLDAATLAAPEVDDRLVVEHELVARESGRKLTFTDRDGGRLARSPAAAHIGASEPLDHGAGRCPFHAIFAS